MQAAERARLAQELQHLHASVCSALSDPTRIAILYELAEQPHNVSGLVEALGLPQSSVSRHLRTLREHRLVHATRQGANVVYSLVDRRVIAALDLLRQVLAESLAENAALVEMLDEAHPVG